MSISDLCSVIREVLDKPDLTINPNDTFDYLGLTSFDLAVVIALIEDRYGVRPDINRISADRTIDGLLKSINY